MAENLTEYCSLSLHRFINSFKKHGFFLIAACPVECEAYSSGVSRSGKKSLLCALCASSEAGGEYILTYLRSKSGTILTKREGLMADKY